MFESRNRNKVIFSRGFSRGPIIHTALLAITTTKQLSPSRLYHALGHNFDHLSGTLRSYAVIIESFIPSMPTSPLTSPNAL